MCAIKLHVENKIHLQHSNLSACGLADNVDNLEICNVSACGLADNKDNSETRFLYSNVLACGLADNVDNLEIPCNAAMRQPVAWWIMLIILRCTRLNE